MALDPSAWFVGDTGATHSAEVARLAANQPGGSDDGVFTPADLKVSPLATPGPSVRIGPGAWKGQNRAASGRSQAFVARNISDTNVAIAATGSSGGRTDLVCLVVRDPSIPGSGGTVGGPYHQVLVVSNVPASTTRLQDIAEHAFTTGIALARVTLPPSTATVQAQHITDLRKLAQPKRETRMIWLDLAAQVALPSSGTSMRAFPNIAASLDIPVWATDITVKYTTNALLSTAANPRIFELEAAAYVDFPGVGWTSGDFLWRRQFILSGTPTGLDSVPLTFGGTARIPTALRGKRVDLRSYMQSLNSAVTSTLTLPKGTFLCIEVELSEAPL